MGADERFTGTPDGWATVSDAVWDKSHEATRAALEGESAVDRLAAYYSRSGNFAGATFVTVGPFDPYRITEGDLLALTLLDVEVGPAAVRRLTEPSRVRGELHRLLSEEHLPLDADLALADNGTLLAMESFHRRVKQAISPADSTSANPWVTASKLTARKRPDLFPVRDNVVCKALGLQPDHNNHVDWQVFRRLIQDQVVRERLIAVVDAAARRPGVDVGTGPHLLRHLDVVLWMTYRRNANSLVAAEESAP